MNKTLGICLLLLGLFGHFPAYNQSVYGVSALHDSLWRMDTTSWTVAGRLQSTLAGDHIVGMHGLACDPVLHECYAVLTAQSMPATRILATIDPGTGACTWVGDLGDRFGSITFREDGQLLGVVEDGGNAASSLFFIDKSNAQVDFATDFGNGDAGEVVAFHADDQLLYHWSGSTNRVMEKLVPYQPFQTPMPVTTNGYVAQIAAAMDLGNGNFLLSDTAFQIRRASAAGLFGPTLMTTPARWSGMAMPPAFRLADNFLCIGDTVVVAFNGVATDTVFIDWDDGTVTTAFPAATAKHTYTSSGNYVVQAGLKNPLAGMDTLSSMNLRVNNLPGMSLNPYRDTLLCQEDTLKLTGSFGGTSRWYRNGVLIPGPHTNVFHATLNGWYNMTKTNMNGCTDSVERGIHVVFGSQLPAPEIRYDTADCPTIAFAAVYPFSTTWHWTFGDGASHDDSLAIHTYGYASTHTVTLVTSNACREDTIATPVTIGCLPGTQSRVRIFPNPNSGRFVIEVALQAAEALRYRIIDPTGREVLSKTHARESQYWSEEIDIPLASGMYLVELRLGVEAWVYRIMVQ